MGNGIWGSDKINKTLDRIKKEDKDFEAAKVTDEQRKKFTKKHGKDHDASDEAIKSYFKIQERKRLKAEKDAEKAKNQKVTPTEEKTSKVTPTKEKTEKQKIEIRKHAFH